MYYEKTLMKKYPDYYAKKYGYCDYRYEKSFYVPPENDKEDNHNNSSLHIGNLLEILPVRYLVNKSNRRHLGSRNYGILL